MISQQQVETVQGPLEDPRFHRCLVVRPTVQTVRANRYPSQAVVVTSAARKLITLSKEGEKLNAVVVTGGDRDPTMHPEFLPITENLRELVAKWFSKADLCLVSNEPDLTRADVRHAIGLYDRPILRLEAGFQKTFTALTGAEPGQLKLVVEQMGRLDIERLVVHAHFVRGKVDNSQDKEVRAWIKHLDEIRPATVQISTPSKPQGKVIRPVPKTQMTKIADLITEKTGIPVEVCPV